MAHVHRPGRIGRDIFDIDRLARTHVRLAVVRAHGLDHAQFGEPCFVGHAQVNEARSGDLSIRNQRVVRQLGYDLLGQRARIGRGRLRQHHGRVGGEVAVRGIAGRLHSHTGARNACWQRAFCFQRGKDGIDFRGERGVDRLDLRHGRAGNAFARRLEQFLTLGAG